MPCVSSTRRASPGTTDPFSLFGEISNRRQRHGDAVIDKLLTAGNIRQAGVRCPVLHPAHRHALTMNEGWSFRPVALNVIAFFSYHP